VDQDIISRRTLHRRLVDNSCDQYRNDYEGSSNTDSDDDGVSLSESVEHALNALAALTQSTHTTQQSADVTVNAGEVEADTLRRAIHYERRRAKEAQLEARECEKQLQQQQSMLHNAMEQLKTQAGECY
jgi:hypothetical protein